MNCKDGITLRAPSSKRNPRETGSSAKGCVGYVIKYKLQTFSVRPGRKIAPYPCGEQTSVADEVEPVARAIYGDLDADKEHFVMICLNTKNRVTGFKVISTGSLNESLVHPREVWRSALSLCASAAIFVHNHPSGDPSPGPEDICLTARLRECGSLLGIRVLDHIILGEKKFFSFSDAELEAEMFRDKPRGRRVRVRTGARAEKETAATSKGSNDHV